MSLETFLGNPAIQSLSANPLWTVNVYGKMPMDFRRFLEEGRVKGAPDSKALVPIDTILNYFMSLPEPVTPSQFVYSLDCARDGFVILDIESKCPEDIKRKLMTELPYIYGDISMSGNGAHLMFPCPPLDEVTSKKIVMKEEHGWYEILLVHYCSFTLNTLAPANATDQTLFLNLWNELREKQVLFDKTVVDISEQRPDLSFPQYPQLKADIKNRFRARFKKTLADYSGDHSRYELAILGSLKYSLEFMLGFPKYKKLNLDDNQKIWIVYELATELIEHREKHDEFRNNMPWLLYRTVDCFTLKAKKDK